MKPEPARSLRPLLWLVFAGAVFTTAVTVLRSGFVQLRFNWPEDQPAAPLVVATVLLALLLFAVYLLRTGRRSPARTGETPTASGSRATTKPARIGLVAERPTTRLSDVAGVDEAKEEMSEVV